MHIDDLDSRIIFQIFSDLTQEHIHASAVKIIVIVPYIQQGFLAG